MLEIVALGKIYFDGIFIILEMAWRSLNVSHWLEHIYMLIKLYEENYAEGLAKAFIINVLKHNAKN